MYEPNNTDPKICESKKKQLKEIVISTIIGDFRTPFSIMNRTSSNKIKEIEDLNNIIIQLNLTDIYKTLDPITKYTFFSNVHATLSTVGHMSGYKTRLNKFRRIKITKYVLKLQWNEIRN